MKFIIDSMLGTLARKLRIFGFDSLYYNNISDDNILSLCIDTSRILLTSDKELFKRAIKHNVKCILLNGNEEDNLVKISSLLNIRLRFNINNSRCALCNTPLKKVTKECVKNTIPNNVYNRFEEFYYCSTCNKVYWEGSHIRRILEIEEKVNAKLKRWVQVS